MNTTIQTILDSLADIGLGPQRIARAESGDALFGSGGLLNSIELVQFVVALSERSGIDSFEFMESFDGGAGVFESVSSISGFITSSQDREVAV